MRCSGQISPLSAIQASLLELCLASSSLVTWRILPLVLARSLPDLVRRIQSIREKPLARAILLRGFPGKKWRPHENGRGQRGSSLLWRRTHSALLSSYYLRHKEQSENTMRFHHYYDKKRTFHDNARIPVSVAPSKHDTSEATCTRRGRSESASALSTGRKLQCPE